MTRLAAALLILLGAVPIPGLAGGAPEKVPGRQVLILRDIPPPGGDIWIEVRTGPLPRGAVLHLSGPGGEWSTALVAFGTKQGGPASYQVAVPASAAIAGQLELDAQIALPDEALRAPRPEELIGITILPSPLAE